jgi:hypothetical protein
VLGLLGGEADGSSADLEQATAEFVAVRGRLFGIAYRMLAEAEDIVQEAWLRWQMAEPKRCCFSPRLAPASSLVQPCTPMAAARPSEPQTNLPGLARWIADTPGGWIPATSEAIQRALSGRVAFGSKPDAPPTGRAKYG